MPEFISILRWIRDIVYPQLLETNENVKIVADNMEEVKALNTSIEDGVLPFERIVITVDSIDELLELSPSDGDTVIVKDLNRGGTFIYDATQSAINNGGTIFNGWVRQYSGAINVKWFGAVGDGITGELSIFQNIALALKDGDTVYIPAGHYITVNEAADTDDFYMVIEKNGIEIVGDGNATIFDIPIKVRGSVSIPVNVGANGFGSGDETIHLASSLGVTDRDWLQLWGVCHPFSSDAGKYQLGDYNPTYQYLYKARFGEFVQIRDVISSTELETMRPIIYPTYQNSTVGLTTTISGVTSAQAVKVSFINGFKISNMKMTTQNTSFDRMRFSYVKGLDIRDIDFEVENNEDGRWIKTFSCLDVRINDCNFNRDITNYTGGSSWNSIIIGGGSQNVRVDGCIFNNEAQSIDITNGVDVSEVSADFVGDYISYTTTKITNCTFNNCVDSGTWHPGGYDSTYTDNQVIGGGGARIRSRKNLVANNTIDTDIYGITFSSFYNDTLIIGNIISNPRYENADKNNYDWQGILFVNFSSETNNRNAIDNVLCTGNTFYNNSLVSSKKAIHFRHYGNGVNPITSETMTTSEKEATSIVIVENNVFTNCNVNIGRYYNGIVISKNTFLGNLGSGYVVHSSSDCGGTVITGNYFESASRDQIVLPLSQSSSLSFNGFEIGMNTSRGVIGISNPTTGYRYGRSFSTEDFNFEKPIKMSNGTGLYCVRSSGVATTYIDAKPLDGTSESRVYINSNASTSGIKRVTAYGRFAVDELIQPLVDNTTSCGLSYARWSTIYAGTGTINTSDDREKTYLDITEIETLVAKELKASMRKFKFNDAITEKGNEGARIHFGASAQTVKSIFENYGLNGFDYAILCYDEWEEQEEVKNEEGVITQEYRLAGNRYGIRYEELLCFIISAM